MKQLPLKAICFDLGSTLWDDYPTELHCWSELAAILNARGISTSLEELIGLSKQVVQTYSPSLTRSMVWRKTGGQRRLYEAIIAELISNSLARFSDPGEFRRLNPLFEGVHELLEELAASYPLAIVSQNFAEADEWMRWHGIHTYFRHVSLSVRDKLFKPDPRLYVYTCSQLNVEPAHTLMVGDRLDNDIWPANRLRMHSVRVLADPYRIQEPRYPADLPDFTIEHISELSAVVRSLEGRA